MATKPTVVPFELRSEFSPDPLIEVIHAGAEEVLRTAVQVEVSAFITKHAHLPDEEGRQRIVRHGFLPEREMMTGIGAVPVQVPLVAGPALSAQGQVGRRASAMAVPEGYLDRRLQRGAGGASGTGCRGVGAFDDHAP